LLLHTGTAVPYTFTALAHLYVCVPTDGELLENKLL